MRPLTVGSTTFDWGTRTYIMGIINVTPDSFSGDGLLSGSSSTEAALIQAREFVQAGADLLDIGGESTRPGSTPVDLKDELNRVIPIIEVLSQHVCVPLSIDTYKAEVAKQAIQAGASLINDVWGFQKDPAMAQVAAAAGIPVILMHNCSRSDQVTQESGLGGRFVNVHYPDVIEAINQGLLKSIAIAQAAGITSTQIIVDPGIGFGKTVQQNLELIHRLGELKALGYPLLVGPSRKSFVGYSLNLPVDQRLEGTAAAVTLCIDRGADIVRVHDVGAMVRVARIADAISRQVGVDN